MKTTEEGKALNWLKRWLTQHTREQATSELAKALMPRTKSSIHIPDAPASDQSTFSALLSDQQAHALELMPLISALAQKLVRAIDAYENCEVFTMDDYSYFLQWDKNFDDFGEPPIPINDDDVFLDGAQPLYDEPTRMLHPCCEQALHFIPAGDDSELVLDYCLTEKILFTGDNVHTVNRKNELEDYGLYPPCFMTLKKRLQELSEKLKSRSSPTVNGGIKSRRARSKNENS